MPISREVQIENYIDSGTPKLSDFKFVTLDVAEPQDNQVLVKNLWMTVDPYMRGRMVNRESYVPPFKLNTALEGEAIGIVEESNHASFNKGDIVVSNNGWREYFVADYNQIHKLESQVENLSYYLGALGMPGLTAYGSLLNIGKPKKGETVFVSAASGAVGSLVAQIAKLKGCTVIASAGSQDKIDWLKEDLKLDHVFNYKDSAGYETMLTELAPNGIDIYYDNVGGECLQAALNHMNLYGRVIMCGMISEYNSNNPVPGPNNLMMIIGKRLTMQGFIVFDFNDMKPAFYQDMTEWVKSGQIKVKESVLEGIDNAPQAFLNLFSGSNFGKMLVKLS